jgi:hypothetical protein
MENKYFAAQDKDKCAKVLEQKISSWQMSILTSGIADKVRMSTNFYYGSFNDLNYSDEGHKITFEGDQGELVKLPVNHYRNIAQHLLNMVTTNRPALQARAINTDYKSLTQTTLANGLLDYYMREKYLEDVIKKATEYSIVASEGWVKIDWDATAGEQYTYDDERDSFVYEGDIKYKALTMLDVIRDPYKNDEDEHDWLIVKDYKNKYDLAAKYPEMADEILKINNKEIDKMLRLSGAYNTQESDQIAVYEFFHRKTDSMEDGRYMLFLNANLVLIDMPMPYRFVPLFKIQPSSRFGTPFGYTPMFDLIPLQESVNMLYSIIITNQNAFGVQNILIPKGSDINYTQLAGGLNVIEYMPGMPEPKALQLTQTPQEVFGMIDRIQAQMETISGINSVARGNPEASLRSGSALALIQAQAVQFISGLQQSYVRLTESVGTATIKMLQDFADIPRVAAIVGKSNEPYLKEFMGKDLQHINRVVVDISNPVSKTVAGRLEMANNLLQYGAIKDVHQYVNILNTGKLEVMTESTQKELLLISKENEKMMVGESVPVIALDSHLIHIKEHKAILYDPDLRKDPELVQNVLNHIDEHFRMLQETDPAKLQLLGEQPLPPPGAAPPAPGAPDTNQDLNQPPAPGGVPQPEISEPNMPQVPQSPDGLPVNPSENMPQ